jgi:hypothetical protein
MITTDWEKEFYEIDGSVSSKTQGKYKDFIESLLSRKEEEVRKEVVRYIRSNTVNAWSCTPGPIVEVHKDILEAATNPKQ